MCRGSPCASAMGGVSKGAGMMAPALAVPSTRAINTRRTVSSPVLDLTRSSKRVLQGRRGSGELSPTANGGGGAWQYSSFPSMKSQGEDLLKHSSFSRILRSRKVSSTPLPKEESVMLNNNSVKDCPPTPRCPEEPPILSRDEERRAVCSGSEGEESDEEEEDDVEEESSSLLPPSILEQTTPSSLEDEGDEDDHDMHSDNLPRRRYPTLLPDASSHPVPPLPPPPSEMSPPPSPPMPPPPPTIFCSGCSSGCMEGVDHLPVPSLQKKTSIGPLPSSGCDSDNASPPPSSVGDSQTLPVVSEPPLLPTPPSPSAPPSSSSCSTSTCTSSSVSSTTISTSTTLSSSGQRPPRLTTSQLSQMVESQKQKMTALTKARSAMMDQLQELQRLSIVTREFHEINCAASAILQASTHSSSVQRSEYEHAQDRLRFARSLRHAREHFSRTWDEVEEEVTDDSSGDESVDELEGGGRCGGVPPLSSTLLGDAGAVNDPVEEDLEDLGVPRSTNAEDLPGAKPTIRDRALWNYSRKRSILSARWRFVRLQLQRMEKEREKRLKCAREFQYQKGPLLLRSSAPGAGPLFYPSAPRRRFSEVLREPSKPVAEVDDIEGAQDDSAAAAASLPPKPDDGCARTRPLNRTRFKKRNLIRARRCPACSSTGLALWPCFTSFPGGASQAPPSCSWCTVSADHDYAALPPLPPPSILEAAATLDRGLHTKFSSRSDIPLPLHIDSLIYNGVVESLPLSAPPSEEAFLGLSLLREATPVPTPSASSTPGEDGLSQPANGGVINPGLNAFITESSTGPWEERKNRRLKVGKLKRKSKFKLNGFAFTNKRSLSTSYAKERPIKKKRFRFSHDTLEHYDAKGLSTPLSAPAEADQDGLELGLGPPEAKRSRLERTDAVWSEPSTPLDSRESSPSRDSTGSSSRTPGGGQVRGRGRDKYRDPTSSYDIDNIVIPHSIAASVRVPERLPYKEIPTPGWRCRQLSPVVRTSDAVEDAECDEEEDISDEAIERRHAASEVEERKRYLGLGSTGGQGGSGQRRGAALLQLPPSSRPRSSSNPLCQTPPTTPTTPGDEGPRGSKQVVKMWPVRDLTGYCSSIPPYPQRTFPLRNAMEKAALFPHPVSVSDKDFEASDKRITRNSSKIHENPYYDERRGLPLLAPGSGGSFDSDGGSTPQEGKSPMPQPFSRTSAMELPM